MLINKGEVARKGCRFFSITSFIFLFFLSLSLCAHSNKQTEEILLDQQLFLKQAFADMGVESKSQTLWVNKELKAKILDKLDYRLHGLRIRYWTHGKRTAWILEEIGKERPITTGVVVEDAKIKEIKILIYRESRGGEVQYDFFTRQFPDAALIEKRSRYKLDKNINGITGATLSVRAVKKIAKLALFLHNLSPSAQGSVQKVLPLSNKNQEVLN